MIPMNATVKRFSKDEMSTGIQSFDEYNITHDMHLLPAIADATAMACFHD